MIGYVKGKITYIGFEFCYLEVSGGVGYQVFIAESTRQHLQEGMEQRLFTYLHVREDALQLYGFLSEAEHELFMQLLSVSGIGPKVALGILSNSTPEAFKLAISAGDVAMLVRLPGIGKKSAERLILELKDKLKGFLPTEVQSVPITSTFDGNVVNEVLMALQGLGYNSNEVQDLVKELSATHTQVQALLRATLAELGKRR